MAYAPVNGMNQRQAERRFDDASHESIMYGDGGCQGESGYGGIGGLGIDSARAPITKDHLPLT